MDANLVSSNWANRAGTNASEETASGDVRLLPPVIAIDGSTISLVSTPPDGVTGYNVYFVSDYLSHQRAYDHCLLRWYQLNLVTLDASPWPGYDIAVTAVFDDETLESASSNVVHVPA